MCYKSISANAVKFIKSEEFEDIVHTDSTAFIIYPYNLNPSGEPITFFGGVMAIKFKLPAPYEEYAELFDENPDLTAHTPHDHVIDIELGKDSPYQPIYNLSVKELKVLKNYIETSLEKG
ncbi:hypothetical protein FQN51_002505 [Onygenales sp. PD_10]|nr:hypothetical protein FQN51_002505 [Onygenales sp. PD_10]